MQRADYSDRPTSAPAQPALPGFRSESGIADESLLLPPLSPPAPKDPATPLAAPPKPRESPRTDPRPFAGDSRTALAEPQPSRSFPAVEAFERLAPWDPGYDELYELAHEEAEGALLALFSDCFVYFMRAGDMVKIGQSHNPDSRRGALQRELGFPIYLETAVPGYLDVERLLHERFAAGRVFSEWFHKSTPGLEEMIDAAQHLSIWPWDGGASSVCLPMIEIWREALPPAFWGAA